MKSLPIYKTFCKDMAQVEVLKGRRKWVVGIGENKASQPDSIDN